MLAYCTALRVPNAWLIYAGGGSQARVRRIKNSAVEVVECPLDLSQEPTEILARVQQIVSLAMSMTGDAVDLAAPA